MIFSLLNGGGSLQNVISFLFFLPIVLFSLSAHEAAHGYAAWKCGDPTARNLGRLTLNPLKHLDVFGCLCMLVFGFGWAKPVPINSRNFNNPRRDMAITAAAGPLSNLSLGVISSVLSGVFLACTSYVQNDFGFIVLYYFSVFFYFSSYANFTLMAFNLIPLPPFDGSRIATAFLPPRIYYGLMRYERYFMYILLALLFLCSRVFGFSPFDAVASHLSGWLIGGVQKLILAI